ARRSPAARWAVSATSYSAANGRNSSACRRRCGDSSPMRRSPRSRSSSAHGFTGKRRSWWRFSACYSAYLTSISLLVLHAACPYCLTSFALVAAIFALTIFQRPADMSGFSWTPWIVTTLAGAAVVIVLLHLNYTGVFETTSSADPKLAALADHLTAMNAKF